jgi:hypothetical protein
MEEFLLNSIRDANIYNSYSDNLLLNKLESKNTLKYSDEARFQEAINQIKKQKQKFLSVRNNQTLLSPEDFNVNKFILVEFSKKIII